MALPQKLPLALLETQWAQQIDPVLANPILKGQLLQNIVLINGTTIVNHKLGRKLIGWFPVGQTSPANLSDNQATNQMPQLTLSLNSTAATTVSLWVF
jgi:hypothetical protein